MTILTPSRSDGVTLVIIAIALALSPVTAWVQAGRTGSASGASSEMQTSDESIPFILSGAVPIEMVWIKPGTFMMGEGEAQHKVTISQGFWLSKYELTQRQWALVMDTRPWVGKRMVQKDPDHPAVHISWDDAQQFMLKLNEAEGAEVYRLPTEAEWEYACRAGTTTRWSFGDNEKVLRHYAWYRLNTCDVEECYAHKVGTRRSNPWGLYDMHGNVFEWCQDGYSPQLRDPQIDPAESASTRGRVVRGGTFFSDAQGVRSAIRGSRPPEYGYMYVGIRLARQGL
jgi:formylglycine-generating enzyme required for sulfatase activity